MIWTFWAMLVGCSDTHRIRPLVASDSSTSFTSVEVGLGPLGDLEGGVVGRVVPQHVEDVALLDRLLHRVHVERRGLPSRGAHRQMEPAACH